jgi:iron complex outermembrane receptor protein
LDNDLLGVLADFELNKHKKLQWQGGIAANHYVGNHFGNVISIEDMPVVPDRERKYYVNQGRKSDVSAYFRMNYKIEETLSFHIDAQGRSVHYAIKGIDHDLRELAVGEEYLFFNPKAGLYYHWHPNHRAYLSLAIANKEPSRSDFIDNALGNLPSQEHLSNWEAGYVFKPSTKWHVETNLYYMVILIMWVVLHPIKCCLKKKQNLWQII